MKYEFSVEELSRIISALGTASGAFQMLAIAGEVRDSSREALKSIQKQVDAAGDIIASKFRSENPTSPSLKGAR